MLVYYKHKAVSVLEYYLLGGASSYTEEWMRIAGSSHTIVKEMFEDLREV